MVAVVEVVEEEEALVVVGPTAALWELEQPATTSSAAGHRRNQLNRVIFSMGCRTGAPAGPWSGR